MNNQYSQTNNILIFNKYLQTNNYNAMNYNAMYEL